MPSLVSPPPHRNLSQRQCSAPSNMKLVFEVKTEPVTQSAIIVTIVTVSSGSLTSIAIYSQNTTVCVFCSIILDITVYTALRLTPR